MYFCVNEFEVGVNDSIFSGNEQQKVHSTSSNYLLAPDFNLISYHCPSHQVFSFSLIGSAFSLAQEAVIELLIIKFMKKVLESDWLRAVQFQGSTVPKKVTVICPELTFSALHHFFHFYY